MKAVYLILFFLLTSCVSMAQVGMADRKMDAATVRFIKDSLTHQLDSIDKKLKSTSRPEHATAEDLLKLSQLKEARLNINTAFNALDNGVNISAKTIATSQPPKAQADTPQTAHNPKQQLEPKKDGKSNNKKNDKTIPAKENKPQEKPDIKLEAKPRPGPIKYDNIKADTIKRNDNCAFRVVFRGNQYDYLIVDLNKSDIKLHWKNAKGQKYNSIQNLLTDTGALKGNFAELVTNGGMYTETSDPQGLYIEGSTEFIHIDTLDPKSGDNFHLKPNGVFFLDSSGAHIDTTELFALKKGKGIRYATQSGPMLVINGHIHAAFKEGSPNLNVRSGVGIISPNKIVLAISVSGTNFYDFAALFKFHLKCSNALYLDGAISKMYIPGLRDNDIGGHFGPIISITKKTAK